HGRRIVASAPQRCAALFAAASAPNTCGRDSPYTAAESATIFQEKPVCARLFSSAFKNERAAQRLRREAALPPSTHQDSHVVQSDSIAGMLQERDLAEPAVWSHARPPRALVCNDQ